MIIESMIIEIAEKVVSKIIESLTIEAGKSIFEKFSDKNKKNLNIVLQRTMKRWIKEYPILLNLDKDLRSYFENSIVIAEIARVVIFNKSPDIDLVMKEFNRQYPLEVMDGFDYITSLDDFFRFLKDESYRIPEFQDYYNTINNIEQTKILFAIQDLLKRLTKDAHPQIPCIQSPIEKKIHNLPHKNFTRLVGRNEETEKILSILRNPKGYPIVFITGYGGIGKTSLAYEIANRALEEDLFDDIVWKSAKLEELIGGRRISLDVPNLSLDTLCDAILYQLDNEVSKLGLAEKMKIVANVLASGKYLLVIDNLETSKNAEDIAFKLPRLLGKSKAIFTCREYIELDCVFIMQLEELQIYSVHEFLRQEGNDRNLDVIINAKDSELAKIYDAVGGNPLALKLVVGQVRKSDLEKVLFDLKQSQTEIENIRKGEKGGLYTFIYLQSWTLLSDLAKKLLTYLSRTAIAPVSREELEEIRIASNSDTEMALIELADMSLIQVSNDIKEKRYTVHQLTRNFINTELSEIWKNLKIL